MLALIVGSLACAALPPAPTSAAPPTAPPTLASLTAAPDADPAEAVLVAAERYVGVPYRLGREGPDLIDCSGLVFRAFADVGQLSLIGGIRRRAVSYMRWFQARGLMTTNEAEASRGDLVIYDDGSHIAHPAPGDRRADLLGIPLAQRSDDDESVS
jgi:cell wall-associated NlpC family hydrolase